MGDTIKIYDFGSGGVNVDGTPLQMSDNQLRLAQNAIHKILDGTAGALCLRNGYARFNLTRMEGSILGGIEMPVADSGGAPASGGGGGGTGTPIPNTNGDPIGPGTSIDPSVNAGGSNPPGPDLGQGNSLFGGARLILIGMNDNSLATTQNGNGWFVLPKGADQAALISYVGTNGAIVGPPGHPTDIVRPGGTDANNHGFPYTTANGVLYYGEAFAQSSALTDAGREKTHLRRYDGVTDDRIVTFPHNELLPDSGAIAYRSAIVNVIVQYGDGNTLYVVIDDAQSAAAGGTGWAGRIFRVDGLDSRNYATTEIFNSLYAGNGVGFVSDRNTNSYTPYTVEFFGGSLWVGMWRGGLELDGDYDPFIFRIVGPQTSTPPDIPFNPQQVADHTLRGEQDVTAMKRFNGSLYIGTRCAYNKTGGFTFGFAQIYRLDPDFTFTQVYDLDTDFTHSAKTGNGVFALEEFNGNLYASVWNSDTGDGAKILKFDGATWTVVLTLTNTQRPLNLHVDEGILYAWNRASNSTNGMFVTTDGTSWTDQTSNMTPGPGAKYETMNFFYGVNQ